MHTHNIYINIYLFIYLSIYLCIYIYAHANSIHARMHTNKKNVVTSTSLSSERSVHVNYSNKTKNTRGPSGIYIYIHTHKKLKKNTRGPEGHIFLYTPYKYTPKKNGGPEGEKLYFLSIYTLQIAETDNWIRVVIVFMTNRITITTHNVHYSYYSGGPAGKNC